MAKKRFGVRRFLLQLLLIDAVNFLVFRVRFLYLVAVRRRLRMHNDETGVIAHDYSLRQLLKAAPSSRPLRLIRPLSVIQRARPDSWVLSIGCRYEVELLYLMGHGFAPSRVRGLDMISYSPWIDCGNMHRMPYTDDRWDVILAGYTLSYSNDPQAFSREIVRVARHGALIGIAVGYKPRPLLVERAAANMLIGGVDTRIQTVDDILALFAPQVGGVFFRQDAPNPARTGHCTVIFQLDKSRQSDRRSA